MQDLTKDVIITTGIVFTSDTEFYYIFNVFKDNKIADKVRANDVIAFDRVFKELANKYEVNIIYDYGDLTYMQLKYHNLQLEPLAFQLLSCEISFLFHLTYIHRNE